MPESHYARGRAPREGILATQTVSGSEWTAGARLHNHLHGRGRVLVPAYRPGIATISKGDYTLAFWLVPTYAALERRWRVVMRSDGEVDYDIEGVTGTLSEPRDFSTLERWETPRAVEVEKELASQSSTEVGVDVVLGSSISGVSMDIDSIECHEFPRAFITEGGTENGVNLAQFRGSQPIKADAFQDMYAASQNDDLGKRVLFQWAVPYDESGATTTTYAKSTASSTFGDVFDVAIPCLARKKFNDGNAYTVCSARVFAWVSSGGAGEVRVSTADGNSSVVAISNTTPDWTSAITDVNVRHEDLTTSDGLPGGGYDDVQFKFRATAGTLYVASAILYE